ncbi:TetR/AcrR family transcriptional regulator [Rhizobium mongolense]|uniref:AcrR family transcriptional regulator n=2 Tax=Rhizobium mongolense TaxID=57676 RepID=A0ABR6IRS0_9HYPH|nr:TetR/AcrR family transcriptional regulator [Rhizobium mongolense]MBB4230582.1 AcrR family transcriptional regulator [Rhizobium mongolense]TVZ65349.1 TetR family transcriptional regulator [Rhizobium mongolense USDA 1844]
MAKINLERRAKIGRERRAKTRAQIIEAGAMLLAEGSLKAFTVDAVAEAAGVAKGTFYYHFQNIEELVAAVSVQLGQSFDDVLTPARTELRDPIARLSFAFTQSLEKAISDTGWARLVVQTSKTPNEFGRSVRDNLKAEIAEAIAQGRVTVQDPELAADIFVGIWLQVTRGILERVAPPELSNQALEAALRAIGGAQLKSRSL